MAIPGDPEGKIWAEATFADQRGAGFDPVLLSLVAWGPGREAQLIGTAFIIAAFGREALAISAAHNFIHAARVQRPWSLSHASALPEFTIDKTRIVSVDRRFLRALYMCEDKADLCVIGEVHMVPELDIAIMTVSLQEHTEDVSFAGRIAIDTSVPTPGREVVALGYAAMAVRDQEVRNDGFERAILERRVALRRGVITDVHLHGNRVPWPCFETTIPVEGGMSGGPVLWYGDAGAPIVACGMLSLDVSPDEAKNSYQVAGCSTAAMLWPSLGLAVHAKAELGGAPNRIFLLELIRRGIVEDLGNAVTEALVITGQDGRVTISRTVQ